MLEAGEIAERGRHAELLRHDGLYAAMWRRQQEAAQLEEQLSHARKEPVEAPACSDGNED